MTMDDFSLALLTDTQMLKCNQNGIMGKRVYTADGIEVWHTPKKGCTGEGWIGIFNRNNEQRAGAFNLGELGLADIKDCNLQDIWNNSNIVPENGELRFSIDGDGVLFIYYYSSR